MKKVRSDEKDTKLRKGTKLRKRYEVTNRLRSYEQVTKLRTWYEVTKNIRGYFEMLNVFFFKYTLLA
jgi:hypothetical protein